MTYYKEMLDLSIVDEQLQETAHAMASDPEYWATMAKEENLETNYDQQCQS